MCSKTTSKATGRPKKVCRVDTIRGEVGPQYIKEDNHPGSCAGQIASFIWWRRMGGSYSGPSSCSGSGVPEFGGLV
jgi:hypothetical protein